VPIIDQWVRDWYGLQLHTDRPGYARVPATAKAAAAHAAGFIAALDLIDGDLAGQLVANGDATIDRPVWHLAQARDHAWHVITTLTASAHRFGCTSLPTSQGQWKPTLVQDTTISRKAYPTLRSEADPDTPPRFTRKTVEAISLDLSRQPGQRLTVRATGDQFTLSFGEHAHRDTHHEPDSDGLYSLDSPGLLWQPISGPR
jgi:hypothetical protein